MPRLNIPQKQVRAAGSSGIKADIDISSPQFSAVARLGKSVEGLADQKFEAGVRQQQHVDKGAAAGYAADNSLWKAEIDKQLEEAANKPKVQSQILAKGIEDRRSALLEQMEERGVSAAQKRRLSENFDSLEQNLSVGLEKKQLVESRDLANQEILRAASEMFKEALVDPSLVNEGMVLISSMDVSQKEKNETANRLFDGYKDTRSKNHALKISAAFSIEESNEALEGVREDPFLSASEKAPLEFVAKKRNVSLHSAADSQWLDEKKEEVNESTSIDALNSIETPVGTSQKAINSFESIRNGKIKALKIEKSAQNLQIISALKDGQLLPEDLDSFNLDEEERIFYEGIMAGQLSGLGVEAPEFNTLAGDIKSWSFGPTIPWTGREPDLDTRNDLWKQINSSKYNTNAKLLLGSLMVEAEGLDAKDGEIDVASGWGDMDLSENASRAYSDVSKLVLGKMGGAVGAIPISESSKIFKDKRIKDFGLRKARLDPEDAWDAWAKIRESAEVNLNEDSENIDQFLKDSKSALDSATAASQLNQLFIKRQAAAKTIRTKGAN